MNSESIKNDFYGEIILAQDGGGEIPVLAAIKVVHIDNTELGVMSFQDNSAQRKTMRDLNAKHEGLREIMQELIEKNKELQKLDKAKDKFLSLITHELRTPLNTIVVTSEIINNKIYETEQEFAELLKNLYLQSNHMLELVNDILDITKIHSGKMEFYIELGDPAEVLEQQKHFFNDMAKENNVEIIFTPPSPALFCYFDILRLRQITANLISNAIKFNKPGGKVILALTDRQQFVDLSVSDDGIGIPKEKFESIFNEFETIESISNHHKGTGLGLSIVKSLALGQGGEIKISSIVGKGSTFTVPLPKEKIIPESCYRSRSDSTIIF
jgi:signal transduction histidine kinase